MGTMGREGKGAPPATPFRIAGGKKRQRGRCYGGHKPAHNGEKELPRRTANKELSGQLPDARS